MSRQISYRLPKPYTSQPSQLLPDHYIPSQYAAEAGRLRVYSRADRQINRATGRVNRYSIPAPGHPSNTARAADAVGGVAGIAGAASLAAPALLPVAAALGVGYGVYKLGNSFDLW